MAPTMNMLVAKPARAVEAPKRSLADFDTTVMSSQKFTATRKFSMVMTTKLLVQSRCLVTVSATP